MPKVILDWKTTHDFVKDAFIGVGVPADDAAVAFRERVRERHKTGHGETLDHVGKETCHGMGKEDAHAGAGQEGGGKEMTGGKLTWFRFADAVHEQAFRLSSSDCPMVFVLSDGRVVEPTSVSVDLKPCKGGYKYVVKLEERQ